MTENVVSPKANTKATVKRIFRHESTVLIVVLVALIGAMAGISKGLTSTPANMMNILLQSAIRGVASVGQAFVILTAGIDLSVGGIGLFAAILGATMMTTSPPLNIVGYSMAPNLAMPIMVLAGAG